MHVLYNVLAFSTKVQYCVYLLYLLLSAACVRSETKTSAHVKVNCSLTLRNSEQLI